MFKITPEQVQTVVSNHFDQSDPLQGFCVAQKINFIFMNSGTKYVGYSNSKIVLCQMLGKNKDISQEVIMFDDIMKIKKSKIPFTKIYDIKYKNDRKKKKSLKLWFLSIRGFNNNVDESMKLVERINLKKINKE